MDIRGTNLRDSNFKAVETGYTVELLLIAGGGGDAFTPGGNGGAGGGGEGSSGGSGDSGVAILRYPGSQRGTGGTVTSSGGYIIHTFTASSSYTA